MAAYYRQQAEHYLLRPPPQRRLGELQVPTTLEEWELGDPTRDIDWVATLLLRGRELGGALPLKRVKVAEEEGLEAPLWQPRIEIYLDVSGSMPNPCFAINAMTLAAQILATGTARAGGWVRALLYSSAPVLFWEWARSETEVSRFLMHYVGGGTSFPFGILDASVRGVRRRPADPGDHHRPRFRPQLRRGSPRTPVWSVGRGRRRRRTSCSCCTRRAGAGRPVPRPWGVGRSGARRWTTSHGSPPT